MREKMPYDVCVTDLDDTLLRSDLKISDYTLDVIQRFTRAGGIFCISTGRMYASVESILQQYNLSGYIITCNGAKITDLNAGKVILHSPIPPKNAAEMLKRLEKSGLGSVHAYHDETLYVSGYNTYSENYEKVCNVTAVRPHGSLWELFEKEGWDSTKILAIMSPPDAESLLFRYRGEFGRDYHFSISNPSYFEVMAQGVNKGSALAKLCAVTGREMSRLMAFGDAYNDIEMLRAAGRGFAVSNAAPAVLEAVREVCPSNNDDGVAKTLEKYCLLPAGL